MRKLKTYPLLTGLAVLSTLMPMKAKGQDLYWRWEDKLPSMGEELSAEEKEGEELDCDEIVGDLRQDPRYSDFEMKRMGGFAYDGGFTSGIVDCYWAGGIKDQDFDKLNPGKWKTLCENLRNNSSAVRRLPLNGYNFTTNQIDELLAALHENQSVEYLDLKCTSLRPIDIGRLLFAVKNNPNLKGLDLSGNLMLGYNVKQISAFLRENKTLESLFLGNPYAYPPSPLMAELKFVDREFIKPLTDALRENNTLKCVSFQGWMMTSDAAEELFNTLKKNKSIEILDLQSAFSNQDKTAPLVANFLATDPKLKELSLFGCGFPQGTGGKIAKALERNTHLEVLYANGNYFNSEDYRAVANMIAKNGSLRALYSEGRMDKDVVTLFIHNMAQNFSFSTEDFFCDSNLNYDERNALSNELHFNSQYQLALKDPRATSIGYVNRDTCSPTKKFVFDHFGVIKAYLKSHPDKTIKDYLRNTNQKNAVQQSQRVWTACP
ncbi:MAG: hypothetical protein II942_03910 [Alphaproteobacteria bacterium]|nr:hypothetical protein [Alphaproteobacteria bacterium]